MSEFKQYRRKQTEVHGLTVKEWAKVLASNDDDKIARTLRAQLPLQW